MAKILHDLCGNLVEKAQLVVHRTKCYIPGTAHGYYGGVDASGRPFELDSTLGGKYCEVKNGKATVVSVTPQPAPVIAPAEGTE